MNITWHVSQLVETSKRQWQWVHKLRDLKRPAFKCKSQSLLLDLSHTIGYLSLDCIKFFFSFLDTIDCNHSGTHRIAMNTGKGKVVPRLFVVALLFMIACSSFRELCAYPMIIRFKALYHKRGVNILILMGFFSL